MNKFTQNIRKVKVLGYPFAGGQPRGGVELTPGWLRSQSWFKTLTSTSNAHVVYEEINVSSPHCNSKHPDNKKFTGDILEAKNIDNVMASSEALRNQTYNAIKDGFFPVVLGGDHSQAIGSVAGMKKMFPEGKILWVDAHIDANTPTTSPSRNAHGMPLAYLSGIVPLYQHWNCVNMAQDVCYFGIRSYEEGEINLLREKNTLVFPSEECKPGSMDQINADINQYFNHQAGKTKYWVSFDIDGVDSAEFKSTGTDEGNGITIAFMEKLFERYLPKSVGMDFTEVNFELTQGSVREKDEQTFREMFEFIVHAVNQPLHEEDLTHMSTIHTKTRLNNL